MNNVHSKIFMQKLSFGLEIPDGLKYWLKFLFLFHMRKIIPLSIIRILKKFRYDSNNPFSRYAENKRKTKIILL